MGIKSLDQLCKWVKEWQKEFISGKCEVLHFRKSNLGPSFTVNSSAVGIVAVLSYPGVQVHSSLKVASQVDRVVTNGVLIVDYQP